MIKSIIKFIRNTSRVTIAVIMVFILTVSAAVLSTSARACGDNDIQKNLKDLLGKAKGYGIFAENVLINSDLESNIATNHLKVDGTKDIGNNSNKTNVPGTIYLNHFEAGCLQLRAANNIVLGSDYTRNDNQISFEGGTILDAGYPEEKLGVNSNYINITDTLSTIAKTFNQYTESDNTKGTQVDFSNMNCGTINILNCKDHICIVNITMAEYNTLQPGGLKICKNNDQIIIINVIGNYSEFDLVRYRINESSSAEDNDKNADTVIFNFADYSGTIHLSEVCGIIIAPKADVSVGSKSIYGNASGGTSRGRIIAKSFSNPCGEWHFLAKDLETETETESQTQPPTDPQTEPQTQPQTEPQTEPQTQPQTEPKTQPQTEPQPQPQTEPQPQPQTQPQTEPQTVPQTEPQTQPQTQPQTVPQTEPQTQPQTEPQTIPQTQPQTTQGSTESTITGSTSESKTQKKTEIYADEDQVTKPSINKIVKTPEVNADQDKVQTGDRNPIILYIVAVGISAMIILVFILVERNYKNKKNKRNN